MFMTDKEREQILQAVCDLDDAIVARLFPKDKEYSNEGRNFSNATLWLKTDIAFLLLTQGVGKELIEKIESIIKESPYADVILDEFIHVDEILTEIEIRSDFASALEKVDEGSDLAPFLGHSLLRSDYTSLALLHKSDRYQEKIEYLLSACGEDDVCTKFLQGRYSEFIPDSLKPDVSPEQAEAMQTMKQALLHLKSAWMECVEAFGDARIDVSAYIFGNEKESQYPFLHSFDEYNVMDWVDGCVEAIDSAYLPYYARNIVRLMGGNDALMEQVSDEVRESGYTTIEQVLAHLENYYKE